jgi:hypothetical protein
MNERIKQLADEAGLEFTYDPTETPMRVFVEAWGEDLEKFAQLIVRECAGVGYDASYYECALNVSNKIKQHFGVEE